MHNLAELMTTEETRMDQAVVQRIDGGGIWLQDSSGVYPAKRAAGCLLIPEEGDSVLAAHLAGGRTYVLSVLERASGQTSRLEVEGDLEICTPGGSLEITARDELDLASATKTSFAAPELEVSAGRGKVSIGSLNYFGRLVSSQVDKLSTAARAVDSVVVRLTETIKNRFTKVEDLDRLEAATVSVEARDLHSVSTKYSLLNAEEDAKVDAGIIHLG